MYLPPPPQESLTIVHLFTYFSYEPNSPQGSIPPPAPSAASKSAGIDDQEQLSLDEILTLTKTQR